MHVRLEWNIQCYFPHKKTNNNPKLKEEMPRKIWFYFITKTSSIRDTDICMIALICMLGCIIRREKSKWHWRRSQVACSTINFTTCNCALFCFQIFSYVSFLERCLLFFVFYPSFFLLSYLFVIALVNYWESRI